MTTTRKPGSSKQGSATKEAFALRKELKERYGVESVEELHEKMAALTEPVTTGGPMPIITLNPEPPPADFKIEPLATEPLLPPDDLYWITPDIHDIHIVLRKRNLALRPARDALVPPIPPISIKPYSMGAWGAMPFSLKFDDHKKQHDLRMKYAQWAFFVISRDVAEDMFSDDRWACPEKAVLSHEEFRGWSRASKRALGTYRDLENPDVLREAVRRILQRFNGQAFINMQYHPRMEGETDAQFSWRMLTPNPYGNRLDEVGMPVVRPITGSEPDVFVKGRVREG